MGEPLCAVGAAVSFLALRPLNWGVEAAAAVFFFFSRLVCRSAVRGVKGNISKVKSVGHEERAVEEAKGREGH